MSAVESMGAGGSAWSRSSRAALALVATLLLAACGGGDGRDDGPGVDERVAEERADSEPGAVPWSVAADVVAARRGEYRQVVAGGAAGRPAPMIEEWVAYDLDAPFVDRRIIWRVDPATGDPTEGVSWENPSLRVVYTKAATYMSGQRIEAQCGTKWVEATPRQAADMTGATIDLFRADPGLEPIDILRTAEPEASADIEAYASVYTITVPGRTGLQFSSRAIWEQPGAVDRVDALSTTADVRLPRHSGPVEITVDLAGAMDAAGRPLQDGKTLTATWDITAPLDRVDTTIPAEAAPPGACDIGPSEG